MWIEELGRELSWRILDIWRGHAADGSPLDMPQEQQEAYRRMLKSKCQGSQNTTRQSRTSLPVCHFRGDKIPIATIQGHDLNPSRRWYQCELGLTKNSKHVAGIVCTCTGCGPRCEKYEAESDE